VGFAIAAASPWRASEAFAGRHGEGGLQRWVYSLFALCETSLPRE